MTVSASAHAQPRASLVELDWQAPAVCPEPAVFYAYVAALVDTPPPEPVRVQVRVQRRDSEFVMVMHINQGQRELHDPSCAAVVKSAALVVATTIDLLAEPGASGQPPAPPARVPGVGDNENPLLFADDPAADVFVPRGYVLVGLPVDLSIRIMAGGDSGLLPDLAASVHAMAAVQYRRVRLEVGWSHVFEQRAPRPDAPSMGGDISLNSAIFRTCVDFYRGGVEAAMCGSGEIGWFHSTGYGVAMPLTRRERHVAFGGGVSIAIPVQKPFYIRLDADVSRPLIRPRFSLCTRGTEASCEVPLETFWQPAASVVRTVVGVEVFFR